MLVFTQPHINLFSLSYYRFGELKFDYNTPAGFDRYSGYWFTLADSYLKLQLLSCYRTRNAVIGHKDFDLTYLEEAYTSEHWLVRIYRLVEWLWLKL